MELEKLSITLQWNSQHKVKITPFMWVFKPLLFKNDEVGYDWFKYDIVRITPKESHPRIWIEPMKWVFLCFTFYFRWKEKNQPIYSLYPSGFNYMDVPEAIWKAKQEEVYDSGFYN